MTKGPSYSRITISIDEGGDATVKTVDWNLLMVSGKVKWNDTIDKTGPMDWQ